MLAVLHLVVKLYDHVWPYDQSILWTKCILVLQTLWVDLGILNLQFSQ